MLVGYARAAWELLHLSANALQNSLMSAKSLGAAAPDTEFKCAAVKVEGFAPSLHHQDLCPTVLRFPSGSRALLRQLDFQGAIKFK
jgi:hypothetical protein